MKHGTEHAYVHGCRCAKCRAAGELDLLHGPVEAAQMRQMREAVDSLYGNAGHSVRVPGLRVIEGGRRSDKRGVGYHSDERERGSVVPGGNAGELGLTNDGEGVYRPVAVNKNDADASEDPAKRASRSYSSREGLGHGSPLTSTCNKVGSSDHCGSEGDERPSAQGGTASQVPHYDAEPGSH